MPATFSRLIVHDYLRGEVGYRGVIVSDDLEMGAVSETCAIGEATVRAAGAGHDLLLVCHTEAAQRAAAAALVDAYRSGALPRRDLDPAAMRVRRLRERRAARAEGGAAVPEVDGHALAMAIATRAVTVVSPGRTDFRRALNGRVAAVFPRFSELAGRITIEEAFADERAWLQGALGRVGIRPEVSLVGIEPGEAEIASAGDLSARADATILFLFDAHLYPSNRALLDALQARARRLAVVLLRDPYDAGLLARETLGVTAYGFRRCQMEACIARLGHP